MNLEQNPFKIDRGVAVDAATILRNQWNPNRTTQQQQKAIGESLQVYGQVQELLVRVHSTQPGMYELIDGEHRLDELKGVVYVNVIHGLSDAQAKKLTIVLDGTKGDFDQLELASLLANISLDLGADTGLGLPYSSAELEELIKLSTVDWDKSNTPEGGDIGIGKSDAIPDDTQWISIKEIRLPKEAMAIVQKAYDAIEEERSGLPPNKGVAWGMVLESMAADYLGGAHQPEVEHPLP